MQNVSSTWRTLWASGAARVEAKAVIAGVEYTDLPAPPVITRGTMQGKLDVGNAVSAACALSVRTGADLPRAAQVNVLMRLTDGETFSEWLPAGTFFIARRSADPVTGVVALECYDALLKANAAWSPGEGDWPRPMGDVAAALAAVLGVQIDSRTAIRSGANDVVDRPAAGTTVREMLGAIAAANGGNWVLTPGNRLRLVPLVSPEDVTAAGGGVVAVRAVLEGIDLGREATVTGVRCTAEDVVTLTGDDAGAVIDVSMTPALAVELADAVIGVRYRPFSLTRAVYDPAAELGDRVDYGGASRVLCAERASLGPAFRGDLSAPEPAETSDEYPYIAPQAQAMNLLRASVRDLSRAAVAGTVPLYASGPSATDPPTDGWSATPPGHREGYYVWQKTVTTYVDGDSDVSDPVNISGADGEAATVLRIDSSRGTVFKNSAVSTVLSVAIYRGSERVTDPTALARVFGLGARLQWSWQRMDEDRFGVISADDARLSQGGFHLTLTPADVDTKVTFMCELMI